MKFKNYRILSAQWLIFKNSKMLLSLKLKWKLNSISNTATLLKRNQHLGGGHSKKNYKISEIYTSNRAKIIYCFYWVQFAASYGLYIFSHDAFRHQFLNFLILNYKIIFI